jgi:2-amino-4-hydroxy-6-hydroxymethyldihydropteridine diphosphokinase
MSTAYIALGANLPFEGKPPQATLARALDAMSAAGFPAHARSGLWRSPAWPPSDQPDYYNAVAAIYTGGLSPQALYEVLHRIEEHFGRERRKRWAARTLDLDLLAIDALNGDFGGIELPHPRMHERAFVLAPLAEIAPDWRHPGLGVTTADLLATLPEGQIERVGSLAAG